MQTAQELLSLRIVTGFPEQRLSDLSHEIQQLRAQACVILDPASLQAIGLVRFGDVAANPALAARLLVDLMGALPVHQLRAEDPADAAAGVFETFGPQEIVVSSTTGDYVGLITPESFSTWLLENERSRKAELEGLVSEQKRLVDFLEVKVSNRMAEITDTLNQFTQVALTLSHDIRGPLVSIRGFADFLVQAEGGDLTADGLHAAQRIQNAATKLELMANTLLEDARQRFGGATRKYSSVDLNEVFTDALEFLDAQIRERQAQVILRNRLHLIKGFYVPTLQIFVNVIGNALKFVSPEHSPVIEIWTEETPQGVILSFKDNGVGMSEEQKRNTFQRFALRAHPSISGTGLGLAITRNAVDELGGRIDLQSESGKGTVFVLILQRSSSPEVKKIPASEP